jgi:ribose transport system substrate-binding protein
LIAPADSVQLIPVIKKARDAGIVIINIDNQLDPQASEKIGLTGVPFIRAFFKLIYDENRLHLRV